eukprot:SAG31_NODE_484_length_15037_cov_9.974762_5_plen_536_part_00
MRVAVAGFSHETNTYVDAATGLTERAAFAQLRGAAILEHHAAAARPGGSVVGGFIAAARELGAELVPTFHCVAGPSGTVAWAAFAELRDEMLSALQDAMPFDALAMELHGAGVAERPEGEDLEGNLVKAVRALVGPAVSIVATLDLHGNITEAMVEHVDFFCGYHENPHTDNYERGHEAFHLLPGLLAGTIRPACALEHLPMLIPPTTTARAAVPGRDGSIGADMNAAAAAVEAWPGVLDATFFHGFFKSDTPDVGLHVLVTVDMEHPSVDCNLAQRAVTELASWVWARRDRFRQRNFAPAEAVARAAAAIELNAPSSAAGVSDEQTGGPVVLNEISDNPGSGAPGDGTHLLRAVLEYGFAPGEACFGYLFDPRAAAAAHAAGIGATIESEVELGGHHAPELCGAPLLETNVQVLALSDGCWVLDAFTAGVPVDMGPMALLRLRGAVDVLVCSRAGQVLDTAGFVLHGIDVTTKRVVALKSAVHFRAAFEEIASQILPVDAPGLSTTRTETFQRKRQTTPLWGKDPDDQVIWPRL